MIKELESVEESIQSYVVTMIMKATCRQESQPGPFKKRVRNTHTPVTQIRADPHILLHFKWITFDILV